MIVVIGGGVVGLCVALALQDRGCDVTVADSVGDGKPASWGNAGRIAVEFSEPMASLATLRSLPGALFSRGGPVAFPLDAIFNWLPFGARLIAASVPGRSERGSAALNALLAKALPAWRRRLAASAASGLLVEAGHLCIWENPTAYVSARDAWLLQSGAASVVASDPGELRRLAQYIKAPLAGALRFVGTASIADPAVLLTTLRGSMLARGGRMVKGQASIEAAADGADRVVVTAGVASASLLEAIGHTVPMIAERGYHIEQSAPDWPADMPPIHFEDRAVVVTRFRSALRATSFVEFTRPDAPPDRRKWARLRQHADELGLPFDSGATEWLGSRPTLPDYLPAIGQSRRQSTVFYGFGHQHLGLTLAALTGELMAALVAGEPSDLDLAPFDIERFT